MSVVAPSLEKRRRPSPGTTRRVWAELTRDPNTGVREIGARLGMSYSVVRNAIAVLAEAGYIEYLPGAHRARRVVVPFYLLEKEESS